MKLFSSHAMLFILWWISKDRCGLFLRFPNTYIYVSIFLVPGPPYILSDRQYTDLVDVDFAEPCEPNGQIYGYRAKYQEFGQKFSDPIDYPASQRRIRITGLVQTTRYILELTARTASGYGQKATIEFYTKGAPGKRS